jgi:hypothetical protein
VEEINLAPTDEGYGNILMLFAQNLLGDVPRRRRASDAKILDSILDVTRYLAHAKPDEIQRVREYLKRVGGEL